MTDLAGFKSYTWNGEPIENLSHAKLCEVVGELIDRRDADASDLARLRRDSIWVVPESLRPSPPVQGGE